VTIPLVLVTAGGLARETAESVRAGSTYDLRGYVDDSPLLWGTTLQGAAVLGGIEVLADHPDAAVVVCAGKGTVRQRICERLRAIGVADDRYGTIVHPSVSIPSSCSVGSGGILLAGCVLTASVSVGRHVVCMPNVVLTHDDQVGEYATLCAGVTLGGGVRIGEGAYLGMGSCVREGVQIGDRSVIGMGSVVIADVPSDELWYGVPAHSRAGNHVERKSGVSR
jgi:sugar O-acyltransferase (sialic acid O-acetyltransferase NeuD family)